MKPRVDRRRNCLPLESTLLVSDASAVDGAGLAS